MKTVVYLNWSITKNRVHLGWWVKRVELPMPPFVGLRLCIREIDQDHEIREIWITPKGAIVCDLPENNFRVGDVNCDCSEAEWPAVLAYETEGWAKTEHFDELEP